MSQENLSPRNSEFRELLKQPVEKAAELLSKAFPWLTPNQVTMIGTTLIAALTVYVAKLEKEDKIDKKQSVELITTFFILSLMDALDGALARYKAQNGKDNSHDPKVGQLVDSLSDRVQEAFLSWLSMYRAASSGDKLWLLTATLTALTNPLSSLSRAFAESNNNIVPETGKTPLDILGTRAGRVITAVLRLVKRINIGKISIQAVVDGVTAVATTKIAVQRLSSDSKERREVKVGDDELVEDAKLRFKALAILSIITTSLTGIILYKLVKQKD